MHSLFGLVWIIQQKLNMKLVVTSRNIQTFWGEKHLYKKNAIKNRHRLLAVIFHNGDSEEKKLILSESSCEIVHVVLGLELYFEGWVYIVHG